MKLTSVFRRPLPPLLTLPLWVCAGLAQAQPSTLQECRAIEDRLQRFDCYEGLEVESGQLGAAVGEAPDTVVDVPAPLSERSGGREEAELASFGTEAEVRARLEGDGDGRVELVDRIAGLEMSGHKQWRITLASGQVWAQMLSKTFNLKEGDEVRIAPVERGKYYRLRSPTLSGFIQVRRLQ